MRAAASRRYDSACSRWPASSRLAIRFVAGVRRHRPPRAHRRVGVPVPARRRCAWPASPGKRNARPRASSRCARAGVELVGAAAGTSRSRRGRDLGRPRASSDPVRRSGSCSCDDGERSRRAHRTATGDWRAARKRALAALARRATQPSPPSRCPRRSRRRSRLGSDATTFLAPAAVRARRASAARS